jgi:hypothetical protein
MTSSNRSARSARRILTFVLVALVSIALNGCCPGGQCAQMLGNSCPGGNCNGPLSGALMASLAGSCPGGNCGQ